VLDKPEVFMGYRAADFKRSFEQGNVGDEYRPTLYDVLAWRAVAFYMQREVVNFNEKSGEESPHSKLIAAVMRFHKERGNVLAYADADFNRIMLLDKGEGRDKALAEFVEANRDNEVGARGIAAQARRLFEQKRYAEAHALAGSVAGRDAVPSSGDSSGATDSTSGTTGAAFVSAGGG